MTKEERIAYDKKYCEENKEKRKDRAKRWRTENMDKVIQYEKDNKYIRKKYYNENKKNINKQVFLKRKENIDKWNEYRRNWWANKVKSDPLFKLKNNIKSLICGSFKKKNIRKSKKTIQILGCTFEEYKNHLESKFEPWMNWNNYGTYKPNKERTWQVDHIIPISSAKTQEKVFSLNHYSNLRPLCSKENIVKSSKF